MTRWAIGLSIWVCLGASVARATPASDRCDCGVREVVLPEPGATGVPRNAKIWAVGRYYYPATEQLSSSGTTLAIEPTPLGSYVHSAVRYDLPKLEPQHEYTAEPLQPGPKTHFTTGTDVDLVAPTTPRIQRATIAITPGDAAHEDLGELGLDAAFDADTALVRIAITGGREPITIVTVPGNWTSMGKPVCDTQLPLQPGDHVQLAITAIDLAGNESQPAVQQLAVGLGSSPLEPCAKRHYRCGIGPMFLMIFGVGALVLVLVVAAMAIAHLWARRRALRSAVAEPLSSLAGEHLLGRKQLRAGLVAMLGVTGMAVFLLEHGGSAWLGFLSPLCAGIGIRGFVTARRCLALIELGADVTTLAHRVIVRIGEVERFVDLDTERIAAARTFYTVPISTARTRAGRSSS